MPLEEQVQEVVFGGGLSEKEDPWLQQQGFLALHNCVQEKSGAVVKLPGYAAFTSNVRNATTDTTATAGSALPTGGPRKLVKRGEQIAAVLNGFLYAKQDRWSFQGYASPCVVEQRTVVDAGEETTRLDVCRAGDWVYTVWELMTSRSPPIRELRVSVTYLPTGESSVLMTIGSNSHAHPKLVPWDTATGAVGLLYTQSTGLNTYSGDIVYRKLTPMVVGAQQTLTLGTPAIFDAWADASAGLLFVAAADTTGNTVVTRRYTFSSGGASYSAATNTDTQAATAPTAVCIHADPVTGRVIVGWAAWVASGPNWLQTVLAKRLATANLAVLFAVSTVWQSPVALAGGPPPLTLGGHISLISVIPLYGAVPSASDPFMFVWSDPNPSTGGYSLLGHQYPVTRGRRMSSTGTADTNTVETGLVRLRSRPAWDGVRVQFLAEYFQQEQTTASDRDTQRHAYVLAWEPAADTQNHRFRPLAHFAYGTAGSGTGNQGASTGNEGEYDRISNWYLDAEGDYHFRGVELGGQGATRRLIRDYAIRKDDRVGLFAELGAQTYLVGGLLSAWDGTRVLEAGFCYEPIIAGLSSVGVAPGLTGTFSYKVTYGRYTATGELVRSKPTAYSVTLSPANQSPVIYVQRYHVTLEPQFSAETTFIEIWRTTAGTTSPFYLVGRLHVDPETLGLVTFTDNVTDATILTREQLTMTPEAGELPNEPPLSPLSIAEWRNRLWLTDGEQVGYTKESTPSRAAEFSQTFQSIPRSVPERLTAVAPLGDVLAVFGSDTSSYIYGDGPAANGEGSSLTGPIRMPYDLGCLYPAGVAVVPEGLVVPTRRGFQLLNAKQQWSYIGAAVETQQASFARVRSAGHQLGTDLVWFVVSTPDASSAEFLVYDAHHGTWSTAFGAEFGSTIPECIVHAGDMQTWMSTTALALDRTPGVYLLAGAAYSQVLDMPWMKPAGPSGSIRAKRWWLLMQKLGASDLEVQYAYDFSTSVSTHTMTATELDALEGAPSAHKPRTPFPRQVCQSFKLRFTEQPSAGSRGFRFVALRLLVAQRRAKGKQLPGRHAV